jgi:hypothetical protein
MKLQSLNDEVTTHPAATIQPAPSETPGSKVAQAPI